MVAGRPAEKASLEKAIDIKRRAQRCLQSGDLDGALGEYEKLTRAEEPEPIHFVLMADLLYKKGDAPEAARRYLQAVEAYTGAGLYKNAIAVCKKMSRLALAPAVVLQRLAELHLLDGLHTESALYYQEFAEHQAHQERFREAADSLRQAFETSPENPRLLEKAAGWLVQAKDPLGAAALWMEASRQHTRRGQVDDAARAKARARELDPAAESAPAPAPLSASQPGRAQPDTPVRAAEPVAAPAVEPLEGIEQHRPFAAPAAPAAAPAEPAADLTPPAPAGLRFEPPAAAPAVPPAPAAAGTPDLSEVECLLRLAAERYRKGERDSAGDALVQAARAYEALDRLESAAAIYRSLGRSAHATPEVLALWLRNCEQRADPNEAAEVACSLGDHAITDGDMDGAREWFARAMQHVPEHELATRRLQRMGPRPAAAGPAAPRVAAASTEADGRVEVAVGRAQAVTLDLGALIAEFQRGIESQLSGDAQSHYDLGMTYREMGLFEQAVECFRSTTRDPAFAVRSAEMIGRCLLDLGRFDEAAGEFTRALENVNDGAEASVCLRFQLGLAHEVAGRAPEALAEFERVYAVQPNYPDVAQKIRVLRRALESV
jgi:tetratricopeptide (TPR) repeat protein